ncbi:MAG: electron transport complex subunit RsxC [Planctomycetes bacterium]|nr:electron transport complex subunit RsxC [Planctomycetota bacterium]
MSFLATFRHGVHPPEHKELTSALTTRRMPFPAEVVLPVRQHAGKPAKVVVKKGDHVERGDIVAVADGFVSAPVHASVTGEVSSIEWWPHPDGSSAPAVRIAVSPHSAQIARERTVPDWRGLEPAQIVQAVQDAGVVGLGGAAFPTHVKLAPPKGTKVDTILLNGCECEPYLTTDHRVMVEQADRVIHGLRIMMRCTGAPRAVIGIEMNKPDAIEAIRRVLPKDLNVEVLPLRVKYPQGAEKMLVESVLGLEVPSGKLPISVGALVQNVASAATIAEVFETGLPLIERIVTVTGLGIRKPANLIVPVGTLLRDLLAACGGMTDDAREIVFGGPMMGQAQGNLDVPVTKGTTGVVVLSDAEVAREHVHPCIRCGKCLDACPVFLNPSLLGRYAQRDRWEDMESHHLNDCMLCGACSYVCPSNIPLSQMFGAAKTMLRRTKAADAALAANATATVKS